MLAKPQGGHTGCQVLPRHQHTALAQKAVKHDWHNLHDTTKNELPPCRLKSRKPYNKEAQEMLSVIPEDRSKDA